MVTKIRTQDIANQSVTADKLALPTTKGDLLGYSTLPTRIPVGTDGQLLVVDNSQALGVKWASVAVTLGFADSETPSGIVNGKNDTFTLANTPINGSVHLYKNGLRQKGDATDYTINDATITFVSENIPQTSDILLVDYRY